MRPIIKVLDLFSGAGGFSEGFKEAGFKIVAGLDNFEAAGKTFKTNFPDAELILADIKEVTSNQIESIIGQPDVIIGGPPCEAFTSANFKRMPDPLDRLYKDPRGQLTLHFIRIVGDLQPKVFVMENVIHIADGILREQLKKEFTRIGYKVYFNVLDAEDYGTPSLRRRMFISNVELRPPKSNKLITVWDAIGDLPDPRSDHNIPNHEYVSVGHRRFKRISRLKRDQSMISFIGADGKMKSNFIRLNPYKPAPPVMGRSRFIHPFEDRLLTVREHARLMGFPDNFVFYGGKDSQFDQVGEAVPVPLAKAIADFLLRNINW
ncbi:MAG: DNA cytosine methyltransferase [Thermoprotei archaeon]